ncbi:GGDEF domain-containing protein [Thermodesulfobacterium sp. TA1]|uniref:GGDEF domain-containing protein n=1 Tax=Thermodesulfobacterium sp. TA1 TaxID=2234087 RepID=UPI00143D709F|nr:diguanylate cyclase [Thermodesulfobacterium sp. TA1]
MSIRRCKSFVVYPLSNFPLGEVAEVVCISSLDLKLRLKSIGVIEGTLLEVVYQDPTGERMVIKINETRIALDKDILKHVLVRPLKTSYETLRELVRLDHLTGLLTRQFAENLLKRELANPPYCLVLADIDNFKKFNDTFGHQAGDQVLKEVAQIVKNNLRKTDLAVRWGGEEFAIFLKNTSIELGRSIAERIRKAVANHVVWWQGKALKVTLSLGVCGSPPVRPLEVILEITDKALYQAKNSGKNLVSVCEG